MLGLTCNVNDTVCNSHDNGIWYYNGDYILLIVTVLVVLPLASLKNIEFLGYTSGFSLSCMVFFTIVIIANGIQFVFIVIQYICCQQFKIQKSHKNIVGNIIVFSNTHPILKQNISLERSHAPFLMTVLQLEAYSTTRPIFLARLITTGSKITISILPMPHTNS